MPRRSSAANKTRVRALLVFLSFVLSLGVDLGRAGIDGASFPKLFVSSARAAEAYTVESVPNPREHGGNLSDPSAFLSKADPLFEEKLREYETAANIQIAVVILPSIGSENPKEFATKLFARFGIGDKDTDRGLLVLHVLDQRRVEIETGYGLEGALPDVKCSWILRDTTLPAFKDGQFSRGMRGTLAALALGAAKPEASREALEKAAESDAPKAEAAPLAQPVEPESEHFVPDGFDFASIALLTFLSLLANRAHRKLFPDAEKRPFQGFGCGAIFVLVAWGGVAAFAYFTNSPWFVHGASALAGLFSFAMLRQWLRTASKASARFRTRSCPECGSRMALVRDTIDERFLDRAERLEESIGAFDYDVWNCPKGHKTIERNEGHKPTEACKSCGHHTVLKTSRILRASTHVSEGEREETVECVFCETKSVRVVTIPRETAGSSDGGGGGGSSSSSDFGGGSSGGGGAGGSY